MLILILLVNSGIIKKMTTKIKAIKYMLSGIAIILLFSNRALAGPLDSKCEAEECLNQGKAGEIMKLLSLGLNFLAAAVGILAVILLIIAGIQYTTSGGDPNKVADAKKRIYNVILGVFAFIFMYAFLQWLIPGGIAL